MHVLPCTSVPWGQCWSSWKMKWVMIPGEKFSKTRCFFPPIRGMSRASGWCLFISGFSNAKLQAQAREGRFVIGGKFRKGSCTRPCTLSTSTSLLYPRFSILCFHFHLAKVAIYFLSILTVHQVGDGHTAPSSHACFICVALDSTVCLSLIPSKFLRRVPEKLALSRPPGVFMANIILFC